MNLECLSKRTILAIWQNYCLTFILTHQPFLCQSLELLCAASAHPGQLPPHSLVLQTPQLFRRPSVSTMQLYCTLLSSGQTQFMIRSATLLFLKWYSLLIISDCWDTLPDQIFCWRSNASPSQTVKPIVHLFLIDTEHKSVAMTVISCVEKFKIPTDCSRNVTFWDSLHPNCKPKIVLWEQNRLWILDWTQLPYFDKWPVFLHFGFK